MRKSEFPNMRHYVGFSQIGSHIYEQTFACTLVYKMQHRKYFIHIHNYLDPSVVEEGSQIRWG